VVAISDSYTVNRRDRAGARTAAPIDLDDVSSFGYYAPMGAARFILWCACHTPAGRGRMRKLAGARFRQLHAGPVDVERWGAAVRLYPAANHSERKALFRPDRFNRRELAFLAELFRAAPGVFIDVGANVGLFGLFLAGQVAAGTVILAVEPHPTLFRRMTYNFRGIDRAGRRIDVRTLEAALGDAAGTACLNVDPAHLGSGTIATVGGDNAIPVAMTTLPQLIEEQGLDAIRALKLDVEGYEDRVLGPFFRQAPERLWPEAIVIEHLNRDVWAFDCIGECEARGYRQVFQTRCNTGLKRTPAGVHSL
jgi:FkbM family methyltransferase